MDEEEMNNRKKEVEGSDREKKRNRKKPKTREAKNAKSQ